MKPREKTANLGPLQSLPQNFGSQPESSRLFSEMRQQVKNAKILGAVPLRVSSNCTPGKEPLIDVSVTYCKQ